MTTEHFIKDFAKLGANTEVPQEFMLWCGISGVGAALERRVWIDMGPFTVFPNMYVVLIAGSGRCRKSTSIDMLMDVFAESNQQPRFISHKSTPEALIDALRVTGADGEESIGYGVVDELSLFLNKKSYEAGLSSLLISLFDCKRSIEYRTKGRGIEKLENTCLSILGASTIDWLKNAVPSDAIGGGLTSRMIFVYVSAPTSPVAWPVFTSEQQQARCQLGKFLEGIFELSGPVSLEPPARAFYEERYCDFYTSSELFDDPLLSGYASRRFVHLLKLGIIFSVSRGARDLLVTKDDLEAAEAALEMIEPSMPRVLSMVMATDKGELCSLIYSKIAKHSPVSRSHLMRAFAHRVDNKELTDHLDTLIQAGRIECFSDGGKGLFYRVTSGR